ncbi:MAG: FRG domain-containing protein [Oscillospiraceae bacterium]|nr:FRG domain-containing protein [Oscillospiraceae bacterium]
MSEEANITWYRGHTMSSWKLEPSLFRMKTESGDVKKLTREEVLLAEEYRRHHFSSRTYHKISDKPVENIEWQEVMQHHFVKTRLMDWSERLDIALLFALESFVANPEDNRYKYDRWNASPVLWLLNPTLLNVKVYDRILSCRQLFAEATREFPMKQGMDTHLWNEMREGCGKYLFAYRYPLTNIVSLSQLEAARRASLAQLHEELFLNEFNPFFYMLLRVYSDGIPNDGILPPIAMLHPYHSERILAQRGVFTLFPLPDKHGCSRPMEDVTDCADCLCEIRITDPDTLQREMRGDGNGLTDLYPELEAFGRRLEWM